MKNLIIVFFVLISFSSYAQYDSTRVLQVISSNGNDYLRSLKIRGGLIIPTDTPKIAYKDSGAIAYKQGSTYIWTGRYWSAITGGSTTLPEAYANGNRFTTSDTMNMAGNGYTIDSLGDGSAMYIDDGFFHIGGRNYGLEIPSDNPTNRIIINYPLTSAGITGQYDYSANLTDLDYTQKHYVDSVAGGSKSLQDVTDVGSTTTNAMTVIKADDNIAFSVNGTDTQTKIDMGNSVDNAGYMNFHNSVDVETIGFDGESGNITAKNATLNNLASGASTDSIVTVTSAGVLNKRNAASVGKTYTATLPISINGSNVISMPKASATDSGYVSITGQSFKGAKTFVDSVVVSTIPSGLITDSVITTLNGLLRKTSVGSLVAGSGWGLSGNSATDSVNNFVGTTDSTTFPFRVNNRKRFVLDRTGAATFYDVNARRIVKIGGTAEFTNGKGLSVYGNGTQGGLTINYGQNDDAFFRQLGLACVIGKSSIDAAGNPLVLQTASTDRVYISNSTGNMTIAAGATAGAATAILDIQSTTKGLLIPRMTTTQRDAISTPATSLLIFNTTTNAFNYYNGAAWIFLSSVKNSGSAATDGTATLSSGTATVNTTAVAAGSKILLTYQNCTSCGTIYIGTITAGTSFVINSSNGSDASTVLWSILY